MVVSATWAEFSSSFVVNGVRFEVGSLSWVWRNVVGGMFTADADAVGLLLPAPLHPLRVTRHRTVLTVGGVEVEWRVGSLPPFRSLDVQVVAMVTAGDRPAPPLVPMAGLMTNRGRAAYGAGFLPLRYATTNRVAAELYRILLGWPVMLTDVTRQRLPGHTRYVAGDKKTMLLDVVARSGMPGKSFRESQPLYGIRDRLLLRASLSGHGFGGDAMGRAVASLAVGEHPAVKELREVGLGEHGWSVSSCVEFDQHLVGPVSVVGPADALVEPAPASPVAGNAVLIEPPFDRVELDQGLDGLPFDPAGEFHAETEAATATPASMAAGGLTA